MKEYHKIDTVFKRDTATKFKTLVEGDYANDAFAYLANNEWVFTEKVDGTNIRVMCAEYRENGKQYGITFGGKTDAAQIPAFLVERLQRLFMSDEQRSRLAEMFPDGACLYGEGYGARIQKGGGNYRPDQDFVLFDVKVGEWWLERPNVEDVAHKLGLDVVPIIGCGTLSDMVEMARSGIPSRWGKFQAEGIVARPSVELKTRNGHRIITKIKTRDFAIPDKMRATG
jgi:ATP-dependent RNA circularization protein (DNA/RNA ligase family)